MYEPQKVLEKYQKKLSELLGVDVTKVKSLTLVAEPQTKKPELTKMQKLIQFKFSQMTNKNNRFQAPDVETLLRQNKTQARAQKLSKRKQRPPTDSECRSQLQTDSLNCKKYIAQRMEKAGQNSEYDSIFFFTMYRKAQPQPLRQMVKKVKMINALDEASGDANSLPSRPVDLPEKKKNLLEGQIDLVGQYLSQHRKETLAKDKSLEIKLAEAMIQQVKQDLTQQIKWKERERLQSAERIVKRPLTSCTNSRGMDRYRDLDRFESVQTVQKAGTTKQSMQDIAINTFNLVETPMLTQDNFFKQERPQSSIKQQNRHTYATIVKEANRFKLSKEKKGIRRIERRSDNFYDKQFETVRRSNQELEEMFSINYSTQIDQTPKVDLSGNSLLKVAKSLNGYFSRRTEKETDEQLSQQFKSKSKLYDDVHTQMRVSRQIKIKKKILM